MKTTSAAAHHDNAGVSRLVGGGLEDLLKNRGLADPRWTRLVERPNDRSRSPRWSLRGGGLPSCFFLSQWARAVVPISAPGAWSKNMRRSPGPGPLSGRRGRRTSARALLPRSMRTSSVCSCIQALRSQCDLLELEFGLLLRPVERPDRPMLFSSKSEAHPRYHLVLPGDLLLGVLHHRGTEGEREEPAGLNASLLAMRGGTTCSSYTCSSVLAPSSRPPAQSARMTDHVKAEEERGDLPRRAHQMFSISRRLNAHFLLTR